MRRSSARCFCHNTLACILTFVVGVASGNDAVQGVKFLNFRSYALDLLWDDGKDGVPMGVIQSGGTQDIGTTYVGHVFKIARQPADSGERGVVQHFTIELGARRDYAVEPEAAQEGPAVSAFKRYEALTTALQPLQRLAGLQVVDFVAQTAPTRNIPMNAHFANFKPYDVEQYWDDGNHPGVFQGAIRSMEMKTGSSTYSEHAFKLMRKEGTEFVVVARFVMDLATRTYVLEPDEGDKAALAHPTYLALQRDREHSQTHYAETGVHWLGVYPPDAPTLPLHPYGERVGEVVKTLQVRGRLRHDGTRHEASAYELRALFPQGQGPRAFFIDGLLDEEECAHVVKLAQGKLGSSGIGGGFTSNTRTSQLTFLPAGISKTLQVIHERFADILGVSDEDLEGSAEALQVVRYELGQHYAPHYDFTIDRSRRLLTLLVYLEPPGAGGGTSFPQAFEGKGLRVTPTRGSAILFYSQHPNGNLDELSLHAGVEVKSGVKWVCNLWVHSHADSRAKPRKKEL